LAGEWPTIFIKPSLSLRPGKFAHASVKVAEIKLDILKGSFDTTLEKYKPKIEAPVPAVKSKIPADTKEVYLSEEGRRFLNA